MPAIMPLELAGQEGGLYELSRRGHVHLIWLTGPLDGSRLVVAPASGGVRLSGSPESMERPTGNAWILSFVGSKLGQSVAGRCEELRKGNNLGGLQVVDIGVE